MSDDTDKIPGDKNGNRGKSLANKAKKLASEIEDEAKDAFEKAKKSAEEVADDVKRSAKEFSDDAKEASNDAKEEWNKVQNSEENKKTLVGILAIVLGWIGVHKFVLGYQTEGIILLILGVLGFFTCGITSGISFVIGVIEGIIYLTKSDEEFYTTYQLGKKSWF